MPDPINMVTNLLLRLRPPLTSEGRPTTRPSPPQETTPASPPPSLPMEGSDQSYRLRPSDAGWKSPVLMLPKRGLLKIGLPLPGEKVTIFHPVSPQSGTELIPLPSSAVAQGELWLVRLPEQQCLLLWLPLGIPPQPLNQLWLSLCASEAASGLPRRHVTWTGRCLRVSILLFICCLIFTLI